METLESVRYSDEPTRVGTGVYTTMKWIVVDGIESAKPLERMHRTDEFFKIKDEFDDEGYPSDTGGLSYRHTGGETPMSESHWLRCGATIQLGEYCYRCGMRAED